MESSSSGPSSQERVVFTILAATCAVFILAPNLLVVAVVRRNPVLRSPQAVYVLSLCAVDILAGVLTLPAAVLSHLGLPNSDGFCRALEYLLRLVETAGVYSLVVIAYVRFRALVSQQPRPASFSRAVRYIAAVWIFAMLYALRTPFQYSMAELVIDNGNGTTHTIQECVIGHYGVGDIRENIEHSLLVVDFFLLFINPLTLMITFYSIIIARVRQAGCTYGLGDHSTEQWRVFKTAVILIVTFVVFTLPLYILDLYLYFGPGAFPGEALLRKGLELTSLVVYGVNAIIYALYRPVYRRGITSMLHINVKELTSFSAEDSKKDGAGLVKKRSYGFSHSSNAHSSEHKPEDSEASHHSYESTPKMGIPGHVINWVGMSGWEIEGLPGMACGALDVQELITDMPSTPRHRWGRGVLLSVSGPDGTMPGMSRNNSHPRPLTPVLLRHSSSRSPISRKQHRVKMERINFTRELALEKEYHRHRDIRLTHTPPPIQMPSTQQVLRTRWSVPNFMPSRSSSPPLPTVEPNGQTLKPSQSWMGLTTLSLPRRHSEVRPSSPALGMRRVETMFSL